MLRVCSLAVSIKQFEQFFYEAGENRRIRLIPHPQEYGLHSFFALFGIIGKGWDFDWHLFISFCGARVK